MPPIRSLILLTLLCACARTRILAQIPTHPQTQTGAQKNAIDSLQTPAQVETFLQQFHSRDDRTTLSTTKSVITTLSPGRIRDFGAVSYEKGDFDGNGTTDLLFNGYMDYYSNDNVYPRTGIILSVGPHSYRYTDLTRIGAQSLVAKKLTIGGRDYICTLAHRPPAHVDWNDLPDMIDTLNYIDGYWLDYAQRPHPHRYQQIKYGYSSGAMSIEPVEYGLTIRGDTAEMERLQFDKNTADSIWYEDSTCMLIPAISRKLYDILNNADFPAFKDDYDIPATDQSISDIRIDYDDDEFKLIRDYGLDGTFSLVALYDLMDTIVATQHWQLMGKPHEFESPIEDPNPPVTTDTLVDEGNGIQIAVQRIAAKKKRPHARNILLIHGGGTGGRASFDFSFHYGPSFAQALFRKNFNIYIMDVRGWENSTAPRYNTADTNLIAGSCQEAAADIDAVVNYIHENEHTQRVNLFGWATGGHWASYYTTLHNDKVDNLIILNTLYGVKAPWNFNSAFADPRDSTHYNVHLPVYRESTPQAIIASRFDAIPSADKYLWTDSVSVLEYAHVATQYNAQHTLRVPGGYRRESFNMAHGYQYWNAAAITRPTLIIRSQYDFWSRSIDVTAFYNDLTNAPRRDTLELAKATHFAFLDHADHGLDALVSAIDNFIPRLH